MTKFFSIVHFHYTFVLAISRIGGVVLFLSGWLKRMEQHRGASFHVKLNNNDEMRIVIEPADNTGQKMIAKGLLECGLAKIGDVDAEGNNTYLELHFDFSRVHKKDIYKAFLDIYAKGGIGMDNQELISFLARYTNLGSEASIKTLFYRYKQFLPH